MAAFAAILSQTAHGRAVAKAAFVELTVLLAGIEAVFFTLVVGEEFRVEIGVRFVYLGCFVRIAVGGRRIIV
ncbi:MAG: hypothetical protein C4523_08235 [Myxococcales bacterium]|nr:MAG: hypothetical protein C4523_08235 [Myxococcales bacterium]